MTSWLVVLRQAGENATPREWVMNDRGLEIEVESAEYHVARIDTSYDEAFDREQCERDAEFIVLARNLWPLIVEVLEAAEELQDRADVGHSYRCEFRTAAKGWKRGEPPVIECVCGLDRFDAALASLRAAAGDGA